MQPVNTFNLQKPAGIYNAYAIWLKQKSLYVQDSAFYYQKDA